MNLIVFRKESQKNGKTIPAEHALKPLSRKHLRQLAPKWIGMSFRNLLGGTTSHFLSKEHGHRSGLKNNTRSLRRRGLVKSAWKNGAIVKPYYPSVARSGN